MATKKTTPAEKPTRSWYFPTLGVTVSAATEEEALSLAKSQAEEQEEGDDVS